MAATSTRRIGTALAALLVLPLLLLLAIPAVPFLIAGRLLDQRRRRRLRSAFEARWSAAGKRGVLVYSNSPHWQRYIEDHWLPRLEPQLVVLNWSEREQWPARFPLESEIVRRYLGAAEFNPAAVIFPPGENVRVVRFWQAFRDYRHGKDRALRAGEAELFGHLGIGAARHSET